MMPFMGYELLDSGDGEKLEQFGECTLRRPCSTALWRRSRDSRHWESAHAHFFPKKGWQFHGPRFESWNVNFGLFNMELRLQTNGQVGFFPEHMQYFPDLQDLLEKIKRTTSSPPQVLNLFAYTGMASVFAARHGAEVCHVDIAKKTLEWAEVNFSANRVNSQVRLIVDDAIKFVEREVRRNNRYHIIIADPPSFSRTSKTQQWQLEEVAEKLVSNCCKLLNEQHGALFLTSHHPVIGGIVMGNLAAGVLPPRRYEQKVGDLLIHENGTRRALPCGSYLALECTG